MNEIRDDFEQMLGKDVTVRAGDTLDKAACTHSSWEFIGDDDSKLCVVATELPLAHSAGAALALIPARRAEAQDPDDELIEIYREVVNIISGRLNSLNPTIHLRLDPASDNVVAPESGRATTYHIDIEGYGGGNLSFLD